MKTPEIRKYHIGSTKRSDDIFEMLLTPRITTKSDYKIQGINELLIIEGIFLEKITRKFKIHIKLHQVKTAAFHDYLSHYTIEIRESKNLIHDIITTALSTISMMKMRPNNDTKWAIKIQIQPTIMQP
ncbi:2451_t:CDS:2 [Funneliformis mosseae]|uniref:2451_t:CDS:1 n=1 Tax=Funneliformis mosseae TaxID=27381 RepID=A0A9N8VA79_FUNMO|nr:2451_t:CDS:2 [Funneliformis mosseae]